MFCAVTWRASVAKIIHSPFFIGSFRFTACNYPESVPCKRFNGDHDGVQALSAVNAVKGSLKMGGSRIFSCCSLCWILRRLVFDTAAFPSLTGQGRAELQLPA